MPLHVAVNVDVDDVVFVEVLVVVVGHVPHSTLQSF